MARERESGARTRRVATGRVAALAVVFLALGLTLALPVREWVVQRSTIAALEQQVTDSTQRVEELRIQQERWQDPAYVAAQARARLHFVLPGEVGYVVLGADNEPIDPAAPQDQRDPWWSTLWASLDSAAR